MMMMEPSMMMLRKIDGGAVNIFMCLTIMSMIPLRLTRPIWMP